MLSASDSVIVFLAISMMALSSSDSVDPSSICDAVTFPAFYFSAAGLRLDAISSMPSASTAFSNKLGAASAAFVELE